MTVRRLEGVHLEHAADEILALNAATSEVHALNQSAAAVYELCDGTASKAQMAAEIRRRTSLPADEAIVDLALAELIDAGLVVREDPEPLSTVTRRSLIRRLAQTSVEATRMLPVVETILLPAVEVQLPPRGPEISGEPATRGRTRCELCADHGRGDRRNVDVGPSHFKRPTL